MDAQLVPYLITASMWSSRRAATSQAQANSISSVSCASSDATDEGSFAPISSSRFSSVIVLSLMRKIRAELRVGADGDSSEPPQTDVAAHPRTTKVKEDNMSTITKTVTTRGATVEDPLTPPKRLARIAGVLYLLVGIFGAFAQGFLYPKVYIAGDAATTVRNLLANTGLVRLGVVSDLFQATLWVFVALTLYRLLKHVNKSAASAMVALAAIGAGITMLNAVFEFEGLRVATGAVNLAGFGAAGSNAIALLLVDAQHYGLLIAQVFMGLWLVPMGYLAYKSGWFPKALGVVLIVGGACYLGDMLAAFLVPDLGKAIHGYVTIPSAIAEVSMLGYLLVIGVKIPKSEKPIAPAA